jgi:glycosyltransferase involved in cell wall biosynthesis
MKKILFVESGVYEGGSFMSLVKHIESLDKSKIKPIIVFFNSNKWIEIFKENGYDVYLLNDPVFSKNNSKIHSIMNAFFMKGFIKWKVVSFLKWLHRDAILQMEKIIKEHQVSYVHLNTELFRDRVGLIAAANQNVPIISHLRSKYELGKISFSKEYIEFANINVHKYIAVSNDTADFWTNEVKLSKSKFQVLYDYFEPNVVKSLEDVYDYNGLKLVCVANIVPVKGLEFLLQSVAPILKEFNAKLFLLGKGEADYLAKIKKEIKGLAIEDVVSFVGYRNDVSTFLLQSDLVLLYSKREGLPNVIIEAMGTGSLILATSVGGIPEIINDGVNGFLVPFGDVMMASNKIRYVLQMSQKEASLIKENCIETVRGKFSKEHYISIISKLYE